VENLIEFEICGKQREDWEAMFYIPFPETPNPHDLINLSVKLSIAVSECARALREAKALAEGTGFNYYAEKDRKIQELRDEWFKVNETPSRPNPKAPGKDHFEREVRVLLKEAALEKRVSHCIVEFFEDAYKELLDLSRLLVQSNISMAHILKLEQQD